MVIAVDGYEANQKNRVGIGRYAYEILRRMYTIRAADTAPDAPQFRIFLPEAPLPDMPAATAWWKYVVTGPKKLWTFVGLPISLTASRPSPSVVYSPTHYIPRFVPFRKAMAIMDLSYLTYPELFKSKDLHQLVHWTKYSAGHADAIFTISQFSRRAIIDRYHVDPKRVTVTYPGLNGGMDSDAMATNGKPTSANDGTAITKKYGISRHYILSVGTIQPRKNYIRLIEAFSQFLKKNRQNFGEIDLAIVGKKGWLYEHILAAPAEYGIADRVKFLEFVPDEDLPALYRNALCFALPSLYEGFGLPVLEAMAHGCPVVVSDVSSLPEIAGKAGVYVKPDDTDSIAKGLLAAVRERNLMQGRDRIKRGFEQVKKFSWDQAAKQTYDVLVDLARR